MRAMHVILRRANRLTAAVDGYHTSAHPNDKGDEMADMEDGQRSPAEPMVTDPDKAGTTVQTGSSGTGTPGSSNVAGLKDKGHSHPGSNDAGSTNHEGGSR